MLFSSLIWGMVRNLENGLEIIKLMLFKQSVGISCILQIRALLLIVLTSTDICKPYQH